MAPPDRERLVDEIARLSRHLGTLERELATVADGTPTTGAGDAPTIVTTPAGRPGRRPADASDPPSTSPRLQRAAPTAPRLPPAALSDDFVQRYSAGELLGEGGMGEVRLSMDRRIGRAVAMKVMRPESSREAKLRARFLFEAKVQGQLEHPSIVPVYDLGVRPDGAPFFTMKRVHGRTLHDVLKALAAGDPATQQHFTRHKLLTAFQSACLAVEFAHQRGVVHRDLKPANLMLGSLGELSILDWGLAKVTRGDRAITPSPEAEAALEAARDSEETAVGEILGTPGYMSPEQAAGGAHVDARSDVFALGAMLYEILTLRHLVPGKVGKDVSRATLLGAYDAHISARFPDRGVPLELEEACVGATMHDPSKRTRTAMELWEAVERHLEGDRDVERRRGLADDHAQKALDAIAEFAAAKEDVELAKEIRARAVREVSQALAFDPQHPAAIRAAVWLVTDAAPPPTPESEAAARQIELRSRLKVARRGTLAYGVCAAYLAVVAMSGVKSWLALGSAAAFFLAAAALAFATSRKAELASSFWAPVLIMALSSCGVAIAAGLFGPFVYVPSLCAANVIVFSMASESRTRVVGIVCGALAVIAPLVLEELGVGPPSLSISSDHIEIAARAVNFTPLGTKIVLMLEILGTVIVPAWLVGAERDARTRAERRLAVRAEQLAEFLPGGAAAPRSRL
ncbi:MAG TPA: serine/threonine-protein kinase [Byssovorax sp.]|jgi:serine/threonine-protein kinase